MRNTCMEGDGKGRSLKLETVNGQVFAFLFVVQKTKGGFLHGEKFARRR